MSTKRKLIVMAGFDKNEDGELVPVCDSSQVDTEEWAARQARMIAYKHVVVGWSRKADR